MSEARYSVIRYIPDPGRGERLNIGILLWDEESAEYRLEIEQKAIERVIRENPRLASDSLFYIAPMLNEQLSSAVTPTTARIKSILGKRTGFPLDISEPRLTTISADEDGLDMTLDRLVKRIVRPKRRGGPRHPKPADLVATKLKPLIQSQAVSRGYPLSATKSGVPRYADFFANSGANVALDVVQLAVTKADEIRLRADAEANKVSDILSGKAGVNDYLVYCQVTDDRQLSNTYGDARTVIEAQGARVLTDLDDAVSAISNAAKTG
jgi:hypothetical protein